MDAKDKFRMAVSVGARASSSIQKIFDNEFSFYMDNSKGEIETDLK